MKSPVRGQVQIRPATGVFAALTVTMGTGAQNLAVFARDKGPFDVLFECSGAAAALNAAIPKMRPGGAIVQEGLGGDLTLPEQARTAKELSLHGTFGLHEEFQTGVSLMRKGLIDVKPFIIQSFAIDQALEAFQTARDRPRVLKTQIQFS